MNFDECKLRLQELYNKTTDEDYSLNETYEKINTEFNEVFFKLIEKSIIEKKYFSASPLEPFIIYFNKSLEIKKTEIIDFSEIEYIEKLYLNLNTLFRSHKHHVRKNEYYFICKLNDYNYKLFSSIMRKRIEYLEKYLFKKGIEVITHRPYPNDERINFEFKKHLNLMVQNDILKPIKPTHENTLKWNGTQTEFIELVKALIENGNVKGTQTEIINKLSNVFNIKINNENKLINDIKTRNNGSETLFIDRLQKSLFDYITLEKKK